MLATGWTLLAVLNGYVLATRRSGGLLERLLFTGLIAAALGIGSTQLLGSIGLLARGPLIAVAILWCVGLAFEARVRGGHAFLQLENDVRVLRRLGRSAWEEKELLLLAVPVGIALLVLSTFIALRLPTWSWDCVWYHVPISNYLVQEHSTAWVPTHIWYINGYPRNVELFAAAIDALRGDTRWDDLPQLPFGVLGAFAVAALTRRAGARPSISAGAGALWICLPAVFLQLHTTHADVAGGALFIAAWYFVTARPFDLGARIGAVLAMALYMGTKNLGLFHAAFLVPIFLVRWVLHARSHSEGWKSAARLIVLGVGCVAVLGAPIYVRNTVKMGNPFWPAQIRVPVLGTMLPGELPQEAVAGPPAFFGAPGAFKRMVDLWYYPSQNYFPDVREGPFGFAFPWLFLPAALLVLLIAMFVRGMRRELIWLAALATVSSLVPAAWWGRFVLGIPAAALAAFGAGMQRLPRWWLRAPVAAAALTLTAYSIQHAFQGYRVLPSVALSEEARTRDETRLRETIDWLWTPAIAAYRDRTLRKGDVVVYDRSISFLAELWTPDLRNRVVYLNHDGDDGAYLDTLRALNPRWVAVTRGQRAEQLLAAQPRAFRPIFDVPKTATRMFEAIR